MPLPTQTFPDFASLMAYINNYIIPNGLGLIIGEEHNNVENGLLTFISKSPLNWAKADVSSSGGAVAVSAPVTVFITNTPSSITWGDNIYNEFVFINMTGGIINFGNSLVYYNLNGDPIDSMPANSVLNIVKASNNLWVERSGGSSGGGGSTQKQPNTYVVGTTAGAPTAGTNTWTLSSFGNSWVVLILGRSIFVDMTDAGDGGLYITKPLASQTLTINNYMWNTGDILSYILITP